MKTTIRPFSTALKTGSFFVLVVAGSLSAAVSAQSIPDLGQAAQFAVLAGSTVTNTGSSVVTGELGVSPGTAITGFPPGVVSLGQIRSNDAVAAQAVADLLVAYNNLAGQAVTTEQAAALGMGMVLIPGVYHFSDAADITGELVLDAQGSSAAVFVFQVEEAMTVNSNAAIKLINGAVASNVFWQVGTSATLGTNSAFYGSILAGAGVTMTTGATLVGRALAQTAVTLDSNTVTLASAPAAQNPPEDPSPIPEAELPSLNTVIDSEGQTSTAVIQAGATNNAGASYINSFSSTEQVTIYGKLTPESADIGKSADIFVVVKHTSATGTVDWLMQDANGDFHLWNQAVDTLISAYKTDNLTTSVSGQLFSGALNAGNYDIYIGYTAQGGSLIYSEVPMNIVVTQL